MGAYNVFTSRKKTCHSGATIYYIKRMHSELHRASPCHRPKSHLTSRESDSHCRSTARTAGLPETQCVLMCFLSVPRSTPCLLFASETYRTQSLRAGISMITVKRMKMRHSESLTTIRIGQGCEDGPRKHPWMGGRVRSVVLHRDTE